MADLKELYEMDSLKKTLLLTDGEVSLTDKNIVSEDFSIEQILCDESQLKLGSCKAATLKMKIHNNVISLKNRGLTVSQMMEGADETQLLGTYYVYSDKPTANRKYRDVVAFDSMYYIINEDVKEWYDNVTFPCTLKEFRDSFFEYMEIDQEDIVLVNDDMTINKTIETDEMSGKMVIEAICAVNGCFGQIDYDDVFRYVHLKKSYKGLYPSDTLYPSNDLYPSENNTEKFFGTYISCQYEDYSVREIEGLQIRQDEDDIGVTVGNVKGNAYILEDNFLLYGKDKDELNIIAANLFSVIKQISTYTPFSCTCKGNPTRTIGAAISMYTGDAVVMGYVLKRVIKGVQALKDTYTAKGNEFYDKKVNGSNKSTIQLKKRVNQLVRNVDETISKITRIETDLTGSISELSSSVTQTAEKVEIEVKRATKAEEQLTTQISATAEGLETKVGKGSIISSINQSAEKIKISASKIELEGYVTVTDLSSEGSTTIDGARIDTESLFTREITATKLKLTGESSVQLGGSSTDEKQYVYLVGRKDGYVYESGFKPSQIYMYSTKGSSVELKSDHLMFGHGDNQALIYPNDNGDVLYMNATSRISVKCDFYADKMYVPYNGVYQKLSDVLAQL